MVSEQSAARDSLIEFACAVDRAAEKEYRAKHLAYVAAKLEAVERGEIKRLIIELPVRHWKSSLGSEKFPAWFLGRNYQKEIIATSYGEELPLQFSATVRDTINSNAYREVFAGVRLKRNSKRQDRWALEGAFRMSYRAAGVGGAITGMGADLLIIDDPVKDEQAVATEDARKKLFDWYRTKVRTRLNPGAAIVIIMSRWHEDDLIGKLVAAQEEGGEKWERVRLPALAEEDDPLGRDVGEPLWPERYDLAALEVLRSAVGGRGWAALYQQTPKPDGGFILDSGKLKRISFTRFAYRGCSEAQSMRSSSRGWSDIGTWRSVRQRVRIYGRGFVRQDQHKRFIILHVLHLRGRWPINKVKLIDQCLIDSPGVVQIVESNGTQLGYAQDVKDDIRMRTSK